MSKEIFAKVSRNFNNTLIKTVRINLSSMNEKLATHFFDNMHNIQQKQANEEKKTLIVLK